MKKITTVEKFYFILLTFTVLFLFFISKVSAYEYILNSPNFGTNLFGPTADTNFVFNCPYEDFTINAFTFYGKWEAAQTLTLTIGSVSQTVAVTGTTYGVKTINLEQPATCVSSTGSLTVRIQAPLSFRFYYNCGTYQIGTYDLTMTPSIAPTCYVTSTFTVDIPQEITVSESSGGSSSVDYTIFYQGILFIAGLFLFLYSFTILKNK